MSEYLQENRRAVIMLVVALCVAALGGLYLLVGGGGDDAQAEEPVPHASPTASPTIEPVEPVQPVTDAVVTTVVSRSNPNPFTPLEGSEDDANDPGTSTPPKNTGASPSPSPSPTTKTSRNAPKIDGSSTSDSTKPSDSDSKKKKVDPVPKPIDKGKDAEDSVPVTVLSLEDDFIVARVDGDRTRLYQSVPGVQGVTYVSPLGGNCVWLERAEKPARVSVCRGTTERL
ncbi:MAG: hypothetical protein IPG68_10920 [Micrococcales bacterium]|nr:hypothetical protein [Micrococcales bacterium]